MDNIIECKLESTYKGIYTGLWQYDYGQILRITGADLPKAVEIQFSLNEKGGSVITRIGTTVDGVTEVQIPNELLKNGGNSQNYNIYAYIYLTDETSGNTEYQIVLHVKSRTKPENPSEEPLPEPNIFHETVVAVNASAERAEKALGDVEEIRDNLNLDLSEKITRPQTAEVGQVLAVKEIDESGKPTVFEAEDVKVPTKTSELENDSGFLTEHQDISGKLDKEKLPEAIDDALAQAKESGEFNGKDGAPGEKGEKGDPGETTYVENPYDDTKIKKEIAAKITAPENPEVGKVFKIKSVNDDGTFIGEWADCANLDVRIDGESIVQDGIAEIPIAKNQILGLAQPTSRYRISNRTPGNVNGIYANQYISNSSLDAAVVAAMCDGKGDAWTAEEQAMARERMGVEWTEVFSWVLEEDVLSVNIDLGSPYRDIRLFIKSTTGINTWGIINLFAKRRDNEIYTSVTLNTNYIIKGGNSLFNISKLNDRDIVVTWLSDENYFYNNLNAAQNTICHFNYDAYDISKISITDMNDAISAGTKIVVYAR